MLDSFLAKLPFITSAVLAEPLPPLADRFGLRSPAQVVRDLGEVVRGAAAGSRFQFATTSTTGPISYAPSARRSCRRRPASS